MFETVVAKRSGTVGYRVEDERANYNLFGEVATNPALPARGRPTLCFRPSLRAHTPSVVTWKLGFGT